MKSWYDKGEDATLAEIERLLQEQLGPVTIISKQLKRWRYAQARDVFRTPYLKLDQHPLWLAGDAFLDPQDTSGRTRVESAVISGLRVAVCDGCALQSGFDRTMSKKKSDFRQWKSLF